MLKEEARTSLKIALIFTVFRLYTKDAISGHLTKAAALLTPIHYYITHCINFLSTYMFLKLILIFIMRLVLAFWPSNWSIEYPQDQVLSVTPTMTDHIFTTQIHHDIIHQV